MPRQARLDIPGALHHIMVRGINKKVIFRDPGDKAKFLERLGENIQEAKCSIYAWVIMDNHVHLLFRSGQKGISTVMRKQLTWYAQYFNKKKGRTGYLFENRYKSILCEEDNYFLSLVRYIHLNPVRAKIITTIKELDRYPWTGHRAIVNGEGCPWMDADYVLQQFGARKKAAQEAYREFVEEGLGMGRQPELTGGGLIRSAGGWSQVLSMRRKNRKEEADERILGSGDFVHQVMKEAEEKALRQMKLKNKGVTIDEIIEEECKNFQISRKEIEGGSRRAKASKARAVIARRCVEDIGLSAAEIARELGVNTSSITRALTRVEADNAT